MERIKNLGQNFSSTAIAKNTLYNLLGSIIPIIFAIAFIPALIKYLGTERFGILSISWMIIGYFSFFDFGIAKGLTKIVAEKIGLNQTDYIAKIFWSSMILMTIISVAAAIILCFFIPSLIDLFNISPKHKNETNDTFFILALSIPLVTTMAGLRGMLEAYQKFAIINLFKVFLGAFTFLGPLLVLIFLNSLFWVVAFLIAIRMALWVFYFIQCGKVNKAISREIKFDFTSIKPVLRFSVWITIGNLIVPIILYSDRFLIGILISVTAVAYYVTPYEVVTKLLIIPIALVGVLFPVISASFSNSPEISKKIFFRGVKFIFLMLYPLILVIVTFSFEAMKLWLGEEFANKSYLVLQLLAVGIFMNGLSLIPNTFFQGIGKPKIPTLINLVEFPIYIILMWFSIKNYGINGSAITFLLFAILDALIMYAVAYKMSFINFKSSFIVYSIFVSMIVLIIPFLINDFILKIIFVIVSLLVFIVVVWRYYFYAEEKLFFAQILKKAFAVQSNNSQ